MNEMSHVELSFLKCCLVNGGIAKDTKKPGLPRRDKMGSSDSSWWWDRLTDG